MGEILVRWTARLAVACYLARIASDLSATKSAPRNRSARLVWTVGCALLLAHIAAAFQLVHGWSTAAAWEHTRRQTAELTGWNSGAGLYANYVLAAWWLLDVMLWWWREDWPQQRWAYWPMQTYFAFLTFNATVVFGPRGWIGVAVAFAVLSVGILIQRQRRTLEVCG